MIKYYCYQGADAKTKSESQIPLEIKNSCRFYRHRDHSRVYTIFACYLSQKGSDIVKIQRYINLIDTACNNQVIVYCPCSVIISPSNHVFVCVTRCAFPPISLLSAFTLEVHSGSSVEIMLSQIQADFRSNVEKLLNRSFMDSYV